MCFDKVKVSVNMFYTIGNVKDIKDIFFIILIFLIFWNMISLDDYSNQK